ncbi:MAG: hypothetical protein CME64_17325 [Halobacteriovoraceae bacterium]|nr:hypothetical protein [Halobacteriovoraceae bacterium]|tara:strand:- start:291111 stop:291992 length:882 start_codon:yes stop_codon:yes gene_type:complete
MNELKILITVDWEGTDLEDKNLQRIKQFKREWNVPLTHYLNPGYYTNPKTCELEVTKSINDILFNDDDLGLHLHAPKHFVTSAGVAPRSGPCFSSLGDYNIGEEHGQEVMLHSFPKEDVYKLIKYSKSLMNKYGFNTLRSFRAGGWMSDEAIFESLQENNIFIESSATVASLLEGSSWEGDNLQRYISIIWDKIDLYSDPFFVTTSKGKLLEIPNNLGAIDYWKEDWISILSEKTIQATRTKGSHIAVINSHQETASDHWDKLDSFLHTIKASKEVNVSFSTNSEIAHQMMSA